MFGDMDLQASHTDILTRMRSYNECMIRKRACELWYGIQKAFEILVL